MTFEQRNILENAISSGVLSSEEEAAARAKIQEYDRKNGAEPGNWKVSEQDSTGKSYIVTLANRDIVATIGGLNNYLSTCKRNAEKTVRADSLAAKNVVILEKVINEIKSKV